MRRYAITLVMLVLAALPVTAWAESQTPPVLERYPRLLDGETYVYFLRARPRPAVLTEQTPITGFAFGPGRSEIAYCAPAGEEGRSGLWVVNSQAPRPEPDEDPRRYRTPLAPPRLLWSAPSGAALRGPLWWAPNGTQLAVRAFREEKCELVSVDYATGEAVRLTEGGITAAAWSADGKQIAYVKETNGASAVWLQSFPPGEARKLGEGGLDLRWSLDGKTLFWIDARPGETWTKRAWESGAEELHSGGDVPARPEGTVWSPDGKLCAAVEEVSGGRHLVIYPSGSATGEVVALEGAHPQRVLGWTPDSHLVTVLADRNLPVAVAARQEAALPPSVLRMLKHDKTPYEDERAALVGPPLEPEAGPPLWSANGEMVAYVYRRGEGELSGSRRWYLAGRELSQEELESQSREQFPEAEHALLAIGLRREVIPRDLLEAARQAEALEEGGEEARLRARALSNVQNVAVALNMYLADYEAFPDIKSQEDLRKALASYVKDQSVFMLPGGTEPVVEYLLPPGLRLEDIGDPAATPMVLVSVLPDWDLVGFLDGHAKIYRKGEDYGLDSIPQGR